MKIYRFDDEDAPNINLLDDCLVWWNEEYFCIKEKGVRE